MRLSERFVTLFREPTTPHFLLREAAMDEWGADVATVYVLVGECGEYSDQQTWSVAAYLCPEQARAALARLAEWCESTPSGFVRWVNAGTDAATARLGWRRDAADAPTVCPHDARFKTDYGSEAVNGSWVYFDSAAYSVEAIPLRIGGES